MMARIPLIDEENADAPAAGVLEQVRKGMGMVPNMAKAMANSPAALKGYLRLNAALGGGVLDAVTRERLALAIAKANGCNYCLSIHTHKNLSSQTLTGKEILQARKGSAADARTDAILKFAVAVVNGRGAVTDTQVDAARRQASPMKNSPKSSATSRSTP
jgi:alkylhydroperoxidase family enzyme